MCFMAVARLSKTKAIESLRIVFYGNSTAMAIYWAAPERGEGYEGNALSNFYCSFTCPEYKRDRPHSTDMVREKCLAIGHTSIPQWRGRRGSNLGPPDLQFGALSTVFFKPFLHKDER